MDVVNDLADHDQAVLYFQLWAAIDGGTFWNGIERLSQPLDFDQPWRQVVEAARESALIEASLVVPRPNLSRPWNGSIVRTGERVGRWTDEDAG